MTDFDDEGFSATVKFTSPDADGGSMTSHLVRGMVSTLLPGTPHTYISRRSGPAYLRQRDGGFGQPAPPLLLAEKFGLPSVKLGRVHVYRFIHTSDDVSFFLSVQQPASLLPKHGVSYIPGS